MYEVKMPFIIRVRRTLRNCANGSSAVIFVTEMEAIKDGNGLHDWR
jgi:hypothetical protein